MTLVFDTEITGMVSLHLPINDPSQRQLVQIGAILADEEFKVRGEINLIVKPDGWKISPEAACIHGITQQTAEKCGVDKNTVLNAFVSLAQLADTFVCHNFDFDYQVMAAFDTRVSDVSGRFAHMQSSSFCTMKAMTPICKLLGGWNNYKWPRLTEAYQYAFNESFAGAHDAMADVKACLRLYVWLQSQSEERQGTTK